MKRFIILLIMAVMIVAAQAVVAEELKIEVKNMPPRDVLLLKGTSSVQTIGQDMGDMYEQVFAYMGKMGIEPNGPPIGIYYTEPRPQWEVAVAVPVPVGTAGKDAIESVILPGGKMVSAMHIGPYDKLKESWGAIDSWVKKNEYIMSGAGREIYIVGPGQVSDPAEYRTELLWPIMER